MRGEHKTAVGSLRANLGSSPHARGALPKEDAHNVIMRIIPACAGSTRA